MMDQLDPLVGVWEAHALIDGELMARQRVVCEWIEERRFLVQRVDNNVISERWRGHAPVHTSAVFGLDDGTGQFTMLYADARGVSRVYRADLTGGRLRIWRDEPGFNQRYVGVVSDDTITGAWEMSEDGTDWRKDFDLNYRRLS